MGKVRPLNKGVYEKIAAGEVVERPVSVVKELVENAVDAGASFIGISLQNGGKSVIRITDNGEGFDPDDIQPAFQRHATSKLTQLEDLDRLSTLGFRGEALPSILTVSRIILKTSDNDEGRGTRCVFSDGELESCEKIAFRRGTSIQVNDLFYNFPVRQKFLKGDRSELNQIVSFLEQFSLAYPTCGFKLENNARQILMLDGTESLGDRIYQLFGKEMLDGMQEISYASGTYRVDGFISKQNSGMASKKFQYYFVNQRAVREKTMISSFNISFQRFMEKGKHPAGVLLFTVPPEDVDVNIHPMKLEIRFRDSQKLFRFVKSAVESRMTGMADTGAGAGTEPLNPPAAFPAESPQGESFGERVLFRSGEMEQDHFSVIGQYLNSYIIVQKDEELIIVDQHNAQERINFDRLKAKYTEGNPVSITPLFPIVLEFSPSETSLLEGETGDLLGEIGFELQFMGGTTFHVKRFPQLLPEKNIRDTISSILNIPAGEENWLDNVLAEIACKSAIKVNHPLYHQEMQKLVRELFATENPFFCPHRRPIIISFTAEDIEKMLKRK